MAQYLNSNKINWKNVSKIFVIIAILLVGTFRVWMYLSNPTSWYEYAWVPLLAMILGLSGGIIFLTIPTQPIDIPTFPK